MRYILLIFLLSSCSYTKKYNCIVETQSSKHFFKYSVHSLSEEKAKEAGKRASIAMSRINYNYIGAKVSCEKEEE